MAKYNSLLSGINMQYELYLKLCVGFITFNFSHTKVKMETVTSNPQQELYVMFNVKLWIHTVVCWVITLVW